MGLIKKALFPLIMMLMVVGGAVAADFVKNKDAVPASDKEHSTAKKDKHAADKDDKHAKPKKEKKPKKKKGKDAKGHGKSKGGDHGSGGDNVAYLKFKRQFVVPVMAKGKIDALVIMNLNLELKEDAPDNIYSLEPKLRDAIMRELLSLSSDDVFGENLTSAESYQMLRSTLLRATQAVAPDGVQDILILDIARQER